MLKRTRINTDKYLLAEEKIVVKEFSVGALVKPNDTLNFI